MAERPNMRAGNRRYWGNRSPLHPDMLKARLAEERALELRVQHLTFREIAKEMGSSMEGARGRVRRALDRHLAYMHETANEVRALELARLDAMAQRVWPLLYDPNRVVAATRTLIQIMERRARLLGLDAPRAITIAPGQAVSELPDDELEKLLVQLKQSQRPILPDADDEVADPANALPWEIMDDLGDNEHESFEELLEEDIEDVPHDEGQEHVGGGGGRPGTGAKPPSTPPPPTPATRPSASIIVSSRDLIEI